MIAGQLEIQLLANMARLQSDMDSAKRLVGGAMGEIEKMASMAKAALGALGVGLSAGAFVSWVQGAIEAADSLNDLSKSTGLAVERLAGLRLAAQQSGADLEGTAQAINKLSVKMGENAEKYAKIGVTAKDPLEAFKQLADIFTKIDDPQMRAAFGAEALGKNWAAAAPLLAEGSAGIQEIVDKGAKLSGITKEVAEQADKFNDSMAVMKTISGAAALGIAKDVMPIMTAFAESMIDSKDKTDDLAGVFPKLSEVLRVFIVFGGNVAFTLATVGREIGGIAAQAAAVASGDFKAAFGKGGIGDMMKEDAEKARAAFDKWEAKMLSAGTVAVATAKKTEDATNQLSKADKAAVQGFIAGEKEKQAVKSAIETADASFAADAAKRIALLSAEASATTALTDTQKWALEIMVKVRDGTLGKTEATRIYIGETVAAALAQEKLNAAERAAEEQHKELTAAMLAEIDAQAAVTKGIADSNKSLREQTEEIGLSSEALAALKLARVDDAIAIEQARLASMASASQNSVEADAIRETIAALDDRKLAMQENDSAQRAADAIKAQGDAWKSIEDTAHQTFVSIFDSGKSAFDRLKDTLKNGLLDLLYQMTLKKWVVSIAASVSGTAAAESAFGTTATAGGATGLGSLFSTGSSAYNLYSGGSGLYSSFATSGLGQSLGLSAIGQSTGVAASTSMGLTIPGMATEMTSLGATVGAAIPYVGAAIAAISLLTGALGKRGGAKTEGDAYGTLYGSALSLSAADRFGDNWITGSNSNAVVESLLTPIGTSVAGLIKSMGGNANGLGFNLGFSTDPKGTAQDNIQSGVMDAAGNYVYRNGRNAERGSYSTELALETQRMMVAAVKAADVSQVYKDVANSVNLYTASAEELNTVLSNLTAITTLRTAFDRLGFGADTLSMSLIDAAGGTSALSSNLESYYQNFYSESERQAATLKQVSDAVAGLGLTMPTTREGFRDLVNAQDRTSESGQKTFGALMNLNAAFAAAVPATEKAATAVDTISDTMKSLQATTADLRVELLTAQGKTTEASAAQRAIDTSGMTAAEAAVYDYNAALRAQIDTLNAAKEAEATRLNERSGLQDQLDDLTMTSAQLLAKQRAALDESNRGLFDQINAINAANSAIADFSAQISTIQGARASVSGAKQSVVMGMSGFDAVSYWHAQQAILQAQLSSATTTDAKTSIAGKLQDAIASGLSAQIAAIDTAKAARVDALKEESALTEETASKAKAAAQSMYSALGNIADYVRGLDVGSNSTLSPEAKLRAASSEYNRLLGAAKSGDSDAAGKLTSASDSYLGIAKDYYASSGAYSGIYSTVKSDMSDLGAQASVYQAIADSTKSTFDLATATAAVDAQYQAQVLEYQKAAVAQYTSLDAELGKFQGGLESNLDSTVITLNALGIKNDTIAMKITESSEIVAASIKRVEAAQERVNATLRVVADLLNRANALAEKTASATTTTASKSTLAGAL